MIEVVTVAFTVVSMLIRTTVFLVGMVGGAADPLPPDQGPQIGQAQHTTLQVRPFERTRRGTAQYRTANFVVTAPTQSFAKQVGEAAEYYRHDLAIAWLGKPLPGNWSQPCPITCKVGTIGAGGATSFAFSNGEAFDWNMTIQGSEQRILDSVLPHEVNHTIFASHFRRSTPRWADEGAATLVEHEAELQHQRMHLAKVRTGRGWIPLRRLMGITDYPRDMRDVLTLYAEGWSLTDFLVDRADRATFITFLDDAHRQGWDGAVSAHYGMQGVDDLESQWVAWIDAGSGTRAVPSVQVAVAVGQPVLDVWTLKGCQPCERFKADYRNDRAFRGRLDAAFKVRIHDGGSDPTGANEAGVTAFPTFIVPTRGLRIQGYPGKAQLLRRLRKQPGQQYAQPATASVSVEPVQQPEPPLPDAGASVSGPEDAVSEQEDDPDQQQVAASQAATPSALEAEEVAVKASNDKPVGLFGKFRQAILETIRMILAAGIGWFVSWRASQGFFKRIVIDKVVNKGIHTAEEKLNETTAGAAIVEIGGEIYQKISGGGVVSQAVQQVPEQSVIAPPRRHRPRRRFR